RSSPRRTVRLRSSRRTRFSLVRYCTWANSMAGESLVAGTEAMQPRSIEDGVASVQPSRDRFTWRLGHPWLAPCAQIVSVDCKAEDIGGHKAPLSSLHPDQTDDHAVHGRNNPSLPHAASDHHGRGDGQQAGDVVEMQKMPLARI